MQKFKKIIFIFFISLIPIGGFCTITLGFDVTPCSNGSTNDGKVNLIVTGGTAPYTYSWWNSGATTQNITGLSPTTYTVTVTDNVSAHAYAYVFVGAVNASKSMFVQPDPNTGVHAFIALKDQSDTYGNSNNSTTPSFGTERWTSSGIWFKGRSLIQFDLSSIPTYATITSATLTLYGNTFSILGQANTTDIRRITSSWSKSTVTWNNQPGNTTNGQIVLSSTGTPNNPAMDVTSQVQDMVSNPTGNFGWMSVLEGEANSSYAEMFFNSSDYTTTPTARPRLDITFTVPDNALNWVEETTYDGTGTAVAHTKTYMDNLGRDMQNLKQNFTAGVIIAQQPVYDSYGRAALNTLPAPAGNSFVYKDRFACNASGYVYTSSDYDISATLNNPDAVQNTVPNTLGNYYSDYGPENFVATSSYPFSRTEVTSDPGASPKRSALAGSEYKMGSGHESRTFNMVSGDELQYIFGNDKSFKSSIDASDKLTNSALTLGANIQCGKTISVDADGEESVTYSIGDKVIATCRSGITGGCSMSTVKNNLSYTGTLSVDIHLTRNNKANLKLPIPTYSAAGGSNVGTSDFTYVLYNLENNSLLVPSTDYTINSSTRLVTFSGSYASSTSSNYIRIRIDFSTTFQASVITNSYTVYDTPIQYALDYNKWAVNYYDLAGRLRKTVSPGGINCSSAGTINFSTTYTYSTLGQLVGTRSADKGKTEMNYDKEGKLRFTQNSIQSPDSFSYINYDAQARPIESGEYTYGAGAGGVHSVYFQNYYLVSPVGSPCGTCYGTMEATDDVVDQLDGLVSAEKAEQNYTDYYPIPSGDKISTSYTYYSSYKDKQYLGTVTKTWNANTSTWYCYDNGGRLASVVQQLKDADFTGIQTTLDKQIKTIDYTYNKNTGLVTQQDYQVNLSTTQDKKYSQFFTYDSDLRLSEVDIDTGDGSHKVQAKYYYYMTGALKRTEYGTNVQGLDYAYTINGQLKAINHPSLSTWKDPGHDGKSGSTNANFAADIFAENIDYHYQDYLRTGSNILSSSTSGSGDGFYNGRIHAMRWKVLAITNGVNNGADYIDYGGANQSQVTADTTEEDMQRYTYDELNRLSTSIFGKFVNSTSTFTARTNNDYKEFGASSISGISYDDNGNILTLKRNGYWQTAGSTALMDNLSYTMTSNTNKLASISDAVATAFYGDYTTSAGTSFTYNNFAQLTASTPDGVSAVTYYPSGKTKKITYSGTSNTAEYFYTETNELYKTKYTTNSTGKIKYTWYVNLGGQLRALYEYNTADVTPTFTLTKLPVYGNGRIATYDRSLKLIEYELKDHLGNVRATVKYANVSGGQTIAQVTTRTDYYAFGGPIPGRGYNLGSYRYNAQGQENASNSKWENFDMRMLNYDIGRWMAPDPKVQFYSPFVAMCNSPLNNVDPDGGFVIFPSGGSNGVDKWWGARALEDPEQFVNDAGWKPDDNNDVDSYLNSLYESNRDRIISENGILSVLTEGPAQRYGSVSYSESTFNTFDSYGPDGGQVGRYENLGEAVGALNIAVSSWQETQHFNNYIRSNAAGQSDQPEGMKGLNSFINLDQIVTLTTGGMYHVHGHGIKDNNNTISLSVDQYSDKLFYYNDHALYDRFTITNLKDGAVLFDTDHEWDFIPGELKSNVVDGAGYYIATNKRFKDDTYPGGVALGENSKGWGSFQIPDQDIYGIPVTDVQVSVQTIFAPGHNVGSVNVQTNQSAWYYYFPGTPNQNHCNPSQQMGQCCFIKGTKILMSDGSEKNIEELSTSDSIKTINIYDLKIQVNKIVKISTPLNEEIVTIFFSDSTSTTNTSDHSYFVKNKGWSSFNPQRTNVNYHLNAKQLNIGDKVYKMEGTKLVEVKIVKINTLPIVETITYNVFTEGNNNAYFANRIIVHNESVQKNTK